MTKRINHLLKNPYSEGERPLDIEVIGNDDGCIIIERYSKQSQISGFNFPPGTKLTKKEQLEFANKVARDIENYHRNIPVKVVLAD